MKKITNYIIAGILGCALFTGCSDDALDTAPTGSMPGGGIADNASSAIVALNGMYRSMYSSWSPASNTHQSFGISSYTLMADLMGEDMIQAAAGSGWFWYDCLYQVKDRYASQGWRPYDLWNCFYTWINSANSLLVGDGTMQGSTAEVNYVLGQAYAIRAYSYFMLAQNFARTYKGHEDEPCCPIYTKPTDTETQGQPRSTVKDVYKQILSDINRSIELLGNSSKRKHISHIDVSVAYGLLARIALTMEDWNTAYDAAVAAIDNSGCQIQPVDAFAGLNDVNAGNVMWGAAIRSDQSTMYASFFSHLDYDLEAYAQSAPKQISKDLYALMSASDSRRDWWDMKHIANSDNSGYTQEKFKSSNTQTWEGDYIWMRVEEMHLIAAEAACRKGDEPTARKYLRNLMSKRDLTYPIDNLTGTALGATTSERTGSLLEAIIDQRRIELWGEYGRVWDIRRLKQGFVRTTEMGWPTDALLTGRPTDNPENYMWVMTIPQTEFDGNASLNPVTDQNPLGDE